MIDQRQVTCLSFCELHNCDMEEGGGMDRLRLQATLVVCMCPLKVSYSFLAVNLQFVVKLATADTTR